jgi:hypothetical protein
VVLDWTLLRDRLGKRGRDVVTALRRWCREHLEGEHHILYYGCRYRDVVCCFQRRDDAALVRLTWG